MQVGFLLRGIGWPRALRSVLLFVDLPAPFCPRRSRGAFSLSDVFCADPEEASESCKRGSSPTTGGGLSMSPEKRRREIQTGAKVFTAQPVRPTGQGETLCAVRGMYANERCVRASGSIAPARQLRRS